MPLNIEVTQFPNGVGTAKDNSVLNAVPLPLPNAQLSIEDFDALTLRDILWTATVIGAGVVQTFPLSSSGVIRAVSAGAATDGQKLEATGDGLVSDNVGFSVGQEIWYGIRFRIDDPVNTILIFGFIPDAATVSPADGVYLRSDDVSDVLNLISENNGAAQSLTALGTLAADTWYEASIYWDGIDKVSGQFTGPDGVVGGGGNLIPGANLPAVGLLPEFLFSAGAGAGAKTLDVDYILFGGSRQLT
jgi:hypothetical protein